LLIDHGSRHPDAHEALTWAGASLEQVLRAHSTGEAAPLTAQIVEIAHMELSAPSIADGYARCVERGATEIVVIPCFLSRGRHVTQDIPTQLLTVAQEHPSVSYRLGPPLLELPGFIEMLATYVAGLR
jgi:sirohydrochlorin ferrochelatase